LKGTKDLTSFEVPYDQLPIGVAGNSTANIYQRCRSGSSWVLFEGAEGLVCIKIPNLGLIQRTDGDCPVVVNHRHHLIATPRHVFFDDMKSLAGLKVPNPQRTVAYERE